MEKEFDALLDNELSRIEKDLLDPPPPEVKPYYTNKKEKKISVQYDFCLTLIKKVKLIADPKTWSKIFKEWDFDHVSFDDIEPFLSRPKEAQRTALKKYARQCPEGFSADLLTCVKSVVTYKRIVRKYFKSPEERNEVSAQAAYLYVFLTYASKVSEDNWPDYFKRFCETYEFNLRDLKSNDNRQDVVRKILSLYIEGDPYYFEERFFQTFVTESRIKIARIKRLKAIHRAPIENPHLKPLFQEFI